MAKRVDFFFLGPDYILFYFFNCILGFGVHVRIIQDSCIGTHMAVCFAAIVPFTRIWHFSPGYPSPFLPRCHSLSRTSRLQCVVLPSLCPCVLILITHKHTAFFILTERLSPTAAVAFTV